MLGKSRAAMILAALGAGVASMGAAVQMQNVAGVTIDEAGTVAKQPVRGNVTPAQAGMDAIFRSAFGGYGIGRKRRPGLGYTNMQVKRMARKKRNQARNKHAHRS